MTAIQNGPVAEIIDGEMFVRLDPYALDIGANVRDQVDLSETPEFVESIRDHGVLEAISAVQLADGQIVVRDGQRRTLAAREIGATSIPVIVRLDTATNERARNAERLIAQMEANDQRLALTPGQRAAGAAELLDLGVSVAKVAKAIHEDKAWVEQAAKVGKSKVARSLVDEDQLDFESAAILAEFDGDEDAVQQLLYCPRWRLVSTAEELRAARIAREEFEDAAAPYEDKGFLVLSEHPGYGTVLAMADLRTRDGDEVTIENVEANAEHWTVVLSKGQLISDIETGLPLHEDAIDWYTEGQADIEAGEGLVHVNTVNIEDTWLPEYVCADPDAAGLQLSPVMAAVRAGGPGVDAAVTEGGPRAEAELQRLEAQAEARRKELETEERVRRERKMVRALNLKAEAATVVRRKFLSGLLAAKTPPKSAAAYVATTLAADGHLLTEYRADEVLKEVLAIKSLCKADFVADQVVKAGASRAQVLTLALVLAAQESRIVKDSWRSRRRGTDAYLEYLEGMGHPLTPIEEIMVGRRTPDQVFDLDE
ncbi:MULTISPECIES: ParB/RepB/Spo0J family partition protein [unclassified Rhodococcus (in: high G+C Gram-positive bacteria)]|uniref:ParB/RepB/Spo0J family partition protein n=1 Tax=unclassified Rhodococcus (in: high G+C Gram-positive bacteria) TaxID=192944 RepID=UPI00030BC069|nr:ParB N-terminal domain-containing protein [Rhodococcus sp. DK17]